MNLAILFLLSVGLLGFGLESYAVEFTDSIGHIPDWAINAEQEQIILECESGNYSEKDVDWCLEYLESLLVELKNDPIIREMETRSNSELVIPAPFVDQSKDPQYYIDRYNNEPKYKKWFDETYPQYSSIYQAVGLEELTSEQVSESAPKCPEGEEWIESADICMTPEPTAESESKGGGCLIATATYGTELAPQVQLLREIRDNSLLQTESGTAFMGMFNDIYYSFSPIIADYQRENPVFKEAVKLAITPMITSLSLMENADSESEVLGIGISLIILNLGMYLGVPAVVIVGIKRKI